MPRRKWSEVEAILLELITSEGVMDYAEVAVKLDVALPTASLYCRRLARKYPENISYSRGTLYLEKPFLDIEIDEKKRIMALKQTIKSKEELEAEIKEKIEKILRNHLPHGEIEKTRRELRALLKKLGGL